MSEPRNDDEISKMMAVLEELDHRYSIPLTRQANPPPPPPPLAGHGLQPHNDPMEARVAVIENRLDHIDREVSQVKWWVAGSTLTIILTVVATVIGTGVGIQQMTVATFQAAGAQANPPASAAPPIIINVPGPMPAPAAAAK